MKEKKLAKSKFEILAFIVTIILLVYGVYLIGSTISDISEYAKTAKNAPSAMDYVSYVIQESYVPFMCAAFMYGLGKICNAVRALNPDNYVKEEKSADKK